MRTLIAILSIILLCSCKTREHIIYETDSVYIHDTIEVVRLDSIVVKDYSVVRDSVFVKDSLSVSRDSLGNTLKEVWHYRYLSQSNESRYEALKREYEALRIRKDSVRVETRVEEKVIDGKSVWDRIRIYLFVPLLAVILLLILKNKCLIKFFL